MKLLIKKSFRILFFSLAMALNVQAAPGDAFISWATSIADASTTAPTNVLGAPNLKSTGVSDFSYVWTRNFKPRLLYTDLLGLLNASISGAPLAAPLTAADIDNANIIAFELNGASGAAGGGGWESSTWFFKGIAQSYADNFNEKTGKGNVGFGRRAKFLTGTITCDEYAKYFGIDGTICPTLVQPGFTAVVSWILVDLPNDINVHHGKFSVWLSGAPGLAGSEGTPDPDSIGILSSAP